MQQQTKVRQMSLLLLRYCPIGVTLGPPVGSRSMSRTAERLAQKQADRILCYMNYYFGWHNLTKDKFMLQELKLNNGWITADCLRGFPKLKAFRGLTNAAIASAVSHSKVVETGLVNGRICFRPYQQAHVRAADREMSKIERRHMKHFKHNCEVKVPQSQKSIDQAMKKILAAASSTSSNYRYCSVGFDVEYATVDKGGPRLPALISFCCQCNGENKAWLVRLDKLNHKGLNPESIPVSMFKVLADPRILKIGTGVFGDCIALATTWASTTNRSSENPPRVEIKGVIEIRNFIQGVPSSVNNSSDESLQGFCAAYLNRNLVKSKSKPDNHKMSHWRAKILTDQMRDYAANDISAALQLFDVLNKDRTVEEIEEIVSEHSSSFEIDEFGGVYVSRGSGSRKKTIRYIPLSNTDQKLT